MVKTFLVDDELHDRFKKAVENAHKEHPRGNLAYEHRAAIEDRIKALEAKKK
jgi:hypothetical protein